MDTTSTVPPTPRRSEKNINANIKIKWVIEHKLNFTWDLCLPVPKEGDSPHKRSEEQTSEEEITQHEIVFRVKALVFRDAIEFLLQRFDNEAKIIHSNWVKKPKAERGILPERLRNTRIAVTKQERLALSDCLLKILTEEFDARVTPRRHFTLGNPNASMGSQRLDDSPIPFLVTKSKSDTKSDTKRSRDQTDEDGLFKKLKLPQPQRGESFPNASGSSRSDSFVSIASSVFSNANFNRSNQSFPEVSTPETVSDNQDTAVDMKYRSALHTSFEDKTVSSSDYEVNSSFDTALASFKDGSELVSIGLSDPVIDDELSQDLSEHAIIDSDYEVSELGERQLREKLQGVSPELPFPLRTLPLCVAYEITRVFLHADISLSEAKFVLPTTEYDAFWKFLRSRLVLQGKPFPERCSREAWEAALSDFSRQSYSVYMSGVLRYNSSGNSNPLFRLRLNALRLDASHRSGRRFGYERFLEIDVPNLTGREVPKCLQLVGNQGPEIIIEWLVDERHSFLDRVWKPFHLKLKERKERKADISQQTADELDHSHRVFFFAVDGKDFVVGSLPTSPSKPYVKISIDTLLNRIRPTRKNTKQSFLKLFSPVSRNTPPVLLERSQIRYKSDIIINEKENMTDGAGRISPSLACQVTQKLKLPYPASGFQARFGEAKGLWSVDWNDSTGEDWLEVYKSQSSSPKRMKDGISKLLVDGLTHEIESLRIAMDSPQALRKWIWEVNSNTKERLRAGAISFCGGLPVGLVKKLNIFLDAGFDPKRLHFVKEMARNVFKSKCDELKKKLNITVEKSTYAYMIPDFAGVLEPNEVYLDFSSGFSGTLLKDVDVLVARSPAHYASDIQKVRAVFRVELMGIKDTIVFSTKGGPSLAAKLSSGDYDGDKAWACWEPSSVNNFTNSDVRECPNLVELGYVGKDKTTYEELVSGYPNSISVFLKRSFAFNMEPSLLGICTDFKEKLCYTQESVNTPEAVFLSTLLSTLVDQSKQGYIFTKEDWTRVKQYINIKPQEPLYKSGLCIPNSKHVIDHLMYVASKTIDNNLTEFHKSLPDPPQVDKDLVAYYNWPRDEAERDPTWKSLLDDLNNDLSVIKAEWSNTWGRFPNEESKPQFTSVVVDFYTRFQAVTPKNTATTLARSLLMDWVPDPDLTNWALLRASALFALYSDRIPKVVWHLAGRQLGRLKSYAKGSMMTVTPSMYVVLKPNNSMIDRLNGEGDYTPDAE